LRLLVLGGTVFLGRHIVEAALCRGHNVTLFHRGLHGTDLFSGVERVLGDRDGGLEAVGDGPWDAVVDTSGYVPRVVAKAAESLKTRAGFYVFISSVSAYADLSMSGVTEDAPLASLDDPATESVTGETYGALKAACEAEVQRRFSGRSLIVRPGLIVGPWDPTDRFTYWPVRAALGGDMLAPGKPERPVQFIDVRDLAGWIVTMCELAQGGVFNAVGPNPPMTFGRLLEACAAVARSKACLRWVPDDFLLDCGIEPWSDLPLWLPDRPEYRGMDRVDGTRAWNAGLTTRPLEQTVEDTLRWFRTDRNSVGLSAGLSMEREQEVIARWNARASKAAA